MTLDGSEVEVGNPIYCTVLGPGTVELVNPSSVGVRFASSGQITQYETGGIGPWRRRTLFWADPIVFVPPKNQDAWNYTKSMLIALREMLDERGLL
jgi:hypothetical protein